MALLAPALWLSACNAGKEQQADKAGPSYTCPMHPQIVQQSPGTCPICGMDLVPVSTASRSKSLQLDKNQIALANITTMTVGAGELDNHKRLNGRLAVNPQHTAYISSRVPGRIEQLYVKETGVPVRKGQPLYRIYSEELAGLQQEYLLAAAQSSAFPDNERFRQIEAAARQKLLLYDVPAPVLDRIRQQRQADPYLVYTAPVNGVVAALEAGEGQYVGEGSAIMQLEDYDRLWVEADVYPAELDRVKVGEQVKVVVAGFEDAPVNMRIDFIAPALQTGTQLAQVRGTVPNRGQRWQPGMQADIYLPAGNKDSAISLPTDAVIRDGKGAHVWLRKGRDRFVPQKVKTGTENFNRVEIREGLRAGDNVVVTGAYLLYSEYVLKKGADPLQGR